MNRPLQNITVLDLSSLLPGPFCTMIMADFGARVIKIERPQTGDLMRHYTPRYPLYSGNFAILNRNKESMTLNLKSEQGRDIFFKLVRNSDVVIEGFRPGVMDRLGMGYEDLAAVNPRLVFCSISGFGQESPYRNVAAHDINYLSLNGVLDLAGKKSDPPTLPGILVADIGGGSYPALVGILMALLGRHLTGKGQFVDISMMDCSLLWLYHAAGSYFTSGETPGRGSELTNGGSARYQIYATKDGKYLGVGAIEDPFWNNLCDLLDIDDPRIRVNDDENADLAIAVLSKKFLARTAAEWEGVFAGKDLCCTVITDLAQALSDPHVKSRGLVEEITGPDGLPQKLLANPIKMSDAAADIRQTAPLLGQDNQSILTELGYENSDFQSLTDQGII